MIGASQLSKWGNVAPHSFGSTSSDEVKMQRINSTMNFSRPHPSDLEQRAEMDHNSTREQCRDTVENILLQYSANERCYVPSRSSYPTVHAAGIRTPPFSSERDSSHSASLFTRTDRTVTEHCPAYPVTTVPTFHLITQFSEAGSVALRRR
jgi:hypothetical protein